MTNSPPSNVKHWEIDPFPILTSGLDTVELTLDVEWLSEYTFEWLAELKRDAKETGREQVLSIEPDECEPPWALVVRPHGTKGMEWMLDCREFSLQIGNWLVPQSRPSVKAEIRSETLWSRGLGGAVGRVLDFIAALEGDIRTIRPSRLDLCADILLPECEWTPELRENFVCRARKRSPHFYGDFLTGFSLGSGKTILARLYDKAFEIESKSRKYWMYDIWRLPRIPEGYRVIRVEFQIRRIALLRLGCRYWHDVPSSLPSIWAYCTHPWLRAVDDPTVHHTQQRTLVWWDNVVKGFGAPQGAHPDVVHQAISTDVKTHSQMMVGCLASMSAALRKDKFLREGTQLSIRDDLVKHIPTILHNVGIDDEEYTRRVRQKQARRGYIRG